MAILFIRGYNHLPHRNMFGEQSAVCRSEAEHLLNCCVFCTFLITKNRTVRIALVKFVYCAMHMILKEHCLEFWPAEK